MNQSRESKIDALLSGIVVFGFLWIVVGNLLTIKSSYSLDWWARWGIVIGLALGVGGTVAVSARIFWRHRIGLAAWMLMFGIHALGMALATQLFNWLHPVTAGGAKAPGVNALLLALALVSTLLVRGAVLQDAVEKMPGWMAIRKENESATPRLWLFALYWISPLAWWAGILCAITLATASEPGYWPVAGLLFCVTIAITRTAVRLVLLEKNKYSNWKRSPQGQQKFRAMLVASGFVAGGIVTFYAYFYMAARVQDDVLSAWLRNGMEARAKDLKDLQPRPLAPKDNAAVVYKLARTSIVRVNMPWLTRNWDSYPARNEIARNLTTLSYFRQAAALKEINYGIDYATIPRAFGVPKAEEVKQLALGEARQTARTGDWTTALQDFKSALTYSRHFGPAPQWITEVKPFDGEAETALVLAAALCQPNTHLDDASLAELQKILTEHINSRNEYASTALYLPILLEYGYEELARKTSEGWPGKADVLGMLRNYPIAEWEKYSEAESFWTTLKVATHQRYDRDDMRAIFSRSVHRKKIVDDVQGLFASNLDAMEALRLLETAVAVKRYHLKHGTWPSTLNDCVPEFLFSAPPDPNKRGRAIQYEASPPRVFSIGKGATYSPEEHGFPDEDYFKSFALKVKECESGNHVLFLAN